MEQLPNKEAEVDAERQTLEGNLSETAQTVQEIEKHDPTLIEQVKSTWSKSWDKVTGGSEGREFYFHAVDGKTLAALGLSAAVVTACLTAQSLLSK